MIYELIIGIVSSLIASLIVGLLSNKAISKQNSLILKIYVLFLAFAVFVCCSVISIVLNQSIYERVAKFSEVNLLRFYQFCINSFLAMLVIVVVFSLIVIGIEAYERCSKRDHKELLDRLKMYK